MGPLEKELKAQIQEPIQKNEHKGRTQTENIVPYILPVSEY